MKRYGTVFVAYKEKNLSEYESIDKGRAAKCE